MKTSVLKVVLVVTAVAAVVPGCRGHDNDKPLSAVGATRPSQVPDVHAAAKIVTTAVDAVPSDDAVMN